MKTLFSLSLVLFTSIACFSQVERTKDIKDNPIIKERLAGNYSQIKADIKVSEYFGLETKIEQLLINNFIPSSFPKSIGIVSKSEYIDIANKWLKQNDSFIKPENKTLLITE